jgi:tripartite-type tricarboxylate transporter receptor subunit TctC
MSHGGWRRSGAVALQLQAIRALATLALAANASTLAAQSIVAFPGKPLRMVVPATPGGGTDILARALGARLALTLARPVTIDNRGGAGGIVGSEIVARAPPDGHTLLMAFTTHGTNPSIFSKLPYDTLKDFAPVSLVATAPSVLVVNPSVPVRSIKELIALAKARPGQLQYGTAGSGSGTHLAAVLFAQASDVDLVHVPYKGGVPALADVVGGHVALMFGNIAPVGPLVKAGRLRALAVTSAQRSPLLPQLPTLDELGLKGFDAVAWFGVLVPAGTPAPAALRLNQEIVRALREPELIERVTAQGATPAPTTPEAFAAFIRAEIARWAPVIRQAGIKPE